MLYKFSDVRRIDIELSSECNAACPLCPRNMFGYPNNRGYPEHSMTLDEVKRIFSPEFLNQITEVWINGNFGDMIMNKDTIPIIKYFREHMSYTSDIRCSTNGGARDRRFWTDLAKLEVKIYFCIDGLEDTHSIYRRNTLYDTVINNARTFINAGGHAIWQMIDFDHNRHQQQEAKNRASQMNFKTFTLNNHGRSQGPVFDSDKKLVFVIGQPRGNENDGIDSLMASRMRTDIVPDLTSLSSVNPISDPIRCKAKTDLSIHINSIGDVYPCCFMGYFPKTYEKGSNSYYANVNHQLNQIVYKNNALEYSLEQCIEWFNQIPKTWEKLSYADGRLLVCNNACGSTSFLTDPMVIKFQPAT